MICRIRFGCLKRHTFNTKIQFFSFPTLIIIPLTNGALGQKTVPGDQDSEHFLVFHNVLVLVTH